jgi:hypothetical protein
MSAPASARYMPVIEPALITDRSSLDVLGLPWPFSQIGLLTPEEFLKQAQQHRVRVGGARGQELDSSGLQELHRLGILIPLFRIDLAAGDPGRVVDVTGSRNCHGGLTTVLSELYRAAMDGRVADPAAEPFRPWPTQRRRALWPGVDSGYLYARHQLLALDQAESFVHALEPYDAGNHTVHWRFPADLAPEATTLDALASWRSLAIILTSIDTTYWPPIRHAYHDIQTWRAVRQQFDAHATLSWLGLDHERVTRHAAKLRAIAAEHDVLGDFHDLVRRANPEAWNSLRGDARITIDYHIAAELLDSLADEAQVNAIPAQANLVPVSHQRLTIRPRSLDAVLTDLRVSPHPSVIVGVEGATESLLVPRVAELLGVTLDPAWIQIEEFGGTKKDLALLARYAARPVLGEDRGDYVMLDRPPTRFLVLTDAENKYATHEQRREQRLLLLQSITQDLAPDLRPDLYQRSARVVEIVTWGPRQPFEFAHFTNNHLADALLTCASQPHPQCRSGLVASIDAQRTRSPAPSIERAWKNSRVTKVALADALWPRLEHRIRTAIERGTNGPPIMQGVLRAHELAMHSSRWSIGLWRHPMSR